MDAAPAVSQSTEVPVDPDAAFDLYTDKINRWWRRDSWYWNDRDRAQLVMLADETGLVTPGSA